MNSVYSSLRDRCLSCLEESGRDRILIALAGIPGSGKSTTAVGVRNLLNDDTGKKCTIMPMDGFHLYRKQLMELPNHEDALARRGSPFTIDGRAFVKCIRQLRESCFIPADERSAISAPSFSHEIKDPIDNGITIEPDCNVIIIEGLYLLLDCQPWCEISQLVDDTWFIEVPIKTAAERVVKRHIHTGIENDVQRAMQRVASNDMVNAIHILTHSSRARVQIRSRDILEKS